MLIRKTLMMIFLAICAPQLPIAVHRSNDNDDLMFYNVYTHGFNKQMIVF